MQEKKAVLCILGAGFCWGIIGAFSKPLAQMGYSSFQITAVRCIVTLIVLAGILAVKDRKLFYIEIKDVWMFVGTGILSITLFNVCYFQTIAESTLGLAAILLYTAPFFVILLSALLYKEKITKKKLLALFLAFGGCVLVTGLGSGHIPVIAVLTGLGSGIGYALYTIFGNVALKKYNPLTVTFYTFLFAVIGILPISHAEGIAVLAGTHVMSIFIGILLGIVSTLIPFVLYTVGLKNIASGKASILAFAEPFIATITGIVLFLEEITVIGILGLSCIFASICILNRKSK